MTDVKTNGPYAAIRVLSEGQRGSFAPSDICNACVVCSYACIIFVFISCMKYSNGVCLKQLSKLKSLITAEQVKRKRYFVR